MKKNANMRIHHQQGHKLHMQPKKIWLHALDHLESKPAEELSCCASWRRTTSNGTILTMLTTTWIWVKLHSNLYAMDPRHSNRAKKAGLDGHRQWRLVTFVLYIHLSIVFRYLTSCFFYQNHIVRMKGWGCWGWGWCEDIFCLLLYIRVSDC